MPTRVSPGRQTGGSVAEASFEESAEVPNRKMRVLKWQNYPASLEGGEVALKGPPKVEDPVLAKYSRVQQQLPFSTSPLCGNRVRRHLGGGHRK